MDTSRLTPSALTRIGKETIDRDPLWQHTAGHVFQIPADAPAPFAMGAAQGAALSAYCGPHIEKTIGKAVLAALLGRASLFFDQTTTDRRTYGNRDAEAIHYLGYYDVPGTPPQQAEAKKRAEELVPTNEPASYYEGMIHGLWFVGQARKLPLPEADEKIAQFGAYAAARFHDLSAR